MNPIDMIADLSCPLLALFGIEDQNPTPEQPEQPERLRAELDKHGKTYEWVMYDNAGHAFFADYRPSYRAAPAQDMWPGYVAPGAGVLRQVSVVRVSWS